MLHRPIYSYPCHGEKILHEKWKTRTGCRLICRQILTLIIVAARNSITCGKTLFCLVSEENRWTEKEKKNVPRKHRKLDHNSSFARNYALTTQAVLPLLRSGHKRKWTRCYWKYGKLFMTYLLQHFHGMSTEIPHCGTSLLCEIKCNNLIYNKK